MIAVPDSRALARLLEALRSETPEAATDFELVVGGEPRDGALEACEVSAEGEVGIRFSATLGLSFPDGIVGKKATLDCIVVGVRVRRYTGTVWVAGDGEDEAVTEVLAHSSGFWLDRVELGERYAPAGETPSKVIQTAVSRGPHPVGLVRIEDIPRPLVDRSSFDAFSRYAKPMEVVAAVTTEVPVTVWDTASGGLIVKKKQLVPGRSVWEYVVGRDLDEKDFRAEREEDLYREVAVWRHDDVLGEIELARQEVPGSSAPKGATLVVETSDHGPDAEANAIRQAQDLASALKDGNWKVAATPPWIHPLLERGDTVSFVAVRGGEERRFRVLLASVKDRYPVPAQELSGPALLTKRTRIVEERPRVVRGGSITRARYGFDHLGRLRFSGDFVALVPGRGLVFYPERAAQKGIGVTYETGRGVMVRNG